MKIYKVIIRTPGKLLVINRTLSRTPLEFNATDSELKSLKAKFNLEGITDFSIEEVNNNNPKNIRIISNNKQEQKYEEESSISLLDSFLKD